MSSRPPPSPLEALKAQWARRNRVQQTRRYDPTEIIPGLARGYPRPSFDELPNRKAWGGTGPIEIWTRDNRAICLTAHPLAADFYRNEGHLALAWLEIVLGLRCRVSGPDADWSGHDCGLGRQTMLVEIWKPRRRAPARRMAA